MHKQISPHKLEWWHQAQTAYQKGDAEQLEVILSLCEIEDGHSEKTSVGVIKRLIAQFKTTLRNIQHQINQVPPRSRLQIQNRQDVDDMEKEMRRQLNFDLAIFIKQELAWVESQVALWSTPVESIGRRPVSPPPFSSPGFF